MRSKLRFGLAALFCALLLSNAPAPKGATSNRAQPAEVQVVAPPGAIPVELVNQAADPEGYQSPCVGDGRDARSDLCAQWVTARASADTAWYAKLQLWASAAGMIGLLITILLTLKAVQTSQKSVDVAQDTAKRQLRAYVTLERCRARLVVGEKVTATATLANQGQTPAYAVRMSVATGIVADKPEKFRLRFARVAGKTEPVHECDLGPGRKIDYPVTLGHPLTQSQYDQIIAGKLNLVMAGISSYRDAFGRLRRIVFRMALDPGDLDKKGKALMFASRANNHSN